MRLSCVVLLIPWSSLPDPASTTSARKNTPTAHLNRPTFLTTAIAAEIGLTEPGVVTTPRSKSFASRLAKQIPTRSPALLILDGVQAGNWPGSDGFGTNVSRIREKLLSNSATVTWLQEQRQITYVPGDGNRLPEHLHGLDLLLQPRCWQLHQLVNLQREHCRGSLRSTKSEQGDRPEIKPEISLDGAKTKHYRHSPSLLQ